jgi:hypothetical protein
MNKPTLTFYQALQEAFDHFNTSLFDAALPPCLITLRSANRRYGYHHAQRFISPQGKMIDELGLNPGFFALRPVESVLSTLVHEMVHHWQQSFGKPTRSNAHNREWSEKMVSIGLIPSHTALPGGRQTGRTMTHYILPGGPFITVCNRLVESGFHLGWLDRHAATTPEKFEQEHRALVEAGIEMTFSPSPISNLPEQLGEAPAVYRPEQRTAPSRQRLICSGCGIKAWVEPGTEILCGACEIPLHGKEWLEK